MLAQRYQKKIYHTVGIVAISNRKIRGTDAKSTPFIHFWFGTSTSMKKIDG